MTLAMHRLGHHRTLAPSHLRTVLALLLLFSLACSAPAPEEVPTETVVPVTVEAAQIGSIRGVVHTTGIVSPAPDAELIVIAPEAARIEAIPRAEGERVARGDVLVRFEIPALAADVERQAAEVQRAQAQIANAQANQTRARGLFDRGVAARKEVEDADRELADATAALAQAEAARAAATMSAERQVVRAAFDGVIAKRFHNPGDLVEAAASDPVLRVIDPRRLEVVASVPLSDAPRIVIGAAARLVPAAPGGPAAALKVVSRPAQVDAGTATIPVRLAFASPAGYPVGAPVEADIDAERHANAVLIPSPALVREGEETAVFVANGDKAERRAVQIGLADGRHIEITSGVKAGDNVIVDGQAGLPDGATIRLERDGASAEPAAAAPAKVEEK